MATVSSTEIATILTMKPNILSSSLAYIFSLYLFGAAIDTMLHNGLKRIIRLLAAKE